MGWDYRRHATGESTDTKRAKHVDSASWSSNASTARVLDYQWAGNTFYAIVSVTNGGTTRTVLRVDLTDPSGNSFGYKSMTEEMGPYVDQFPTPAFAAKVFAAIPTARGYAKDFRDRAGIQYENVE